MGREPSMTQATQVPETFSGLPSSMAWEGLLTSSSPLSPISKTPISLVEPYRFLIARRMR